MSETPICAQDAGKPRTTVLAMPPSGIFAGLGRMAVIVALLSAAGLSPVLAEPGAREVTGYAGEAREGASKTWTLPENQPYLFVPFVGNEVAGALVRIEVGRNVGVALFQRPFFASRDVGCTPDLGTDARPHLKWLGPTARFEPDSGRKQGDSASPDPKTGGYASLIVFRKHLGPPPGILMLDRRRTMGSMCPNPIHKIFFNRLFVPVAAPPDAIRCLDLAGTYPVEGAPDMILNFTFTDRAVLLLPSDLSEGYKSIKHSFTATLFDGLGCSGESVSFKSAASTLGDIRLDRHDFRDRARSIRISYESGALASYIKRAAPAVAKIQPPAPQVTAQPETTAPETVQAQAPEPEAAQPETTAPETVQAQVPKPEAAQPIAVEPEPVQPEPVQAQTPEPEAVQPIAAQPEPVQPETATPETATPEPLTSGPAKAPITEVPPAPRKVPAAQTPPQPADVQVALPKIVPKIVPQVRKDLTLAMATQTFQFPVHEIYRLNYCLKWGKDCGQPAAKAWCETQGFRHASDWKVDENIGSFFPTIVMGDNRVCSQFVCDGFREITCAK
ncbi:MAG: hypothetical protein V3S59_04360 [Alphaproteobacteria bacterium]